MLLCLTLRVCSHWFGWFFWPDLKIIHKDKIHIPKDKKKKKRNGFYGTYFAKTNIQTNVYYVQDQCVCTFDGILTR